MTDINLGDLIRANTEAEGPTRTVVELNQDGTFYTLYLPDGATQFVGATYALADITLFKKVNPA